MASLPYRTLAVSGVSFDWSLQLNNKGRLTGLDQKYN